MRQGGGVGKVEAGSKRLMGELKEEDVDHGKEKRAVQAVHCSVRWQADAPRGSFLNVS